MSTQRLDPLDERLLLLTPTANDAAEARAVLTREGFAVQVCGTLSEVCDEVSRGVGAVIIAEEAMNQKDLRLLAESMKAQPPWSDVPIIVLTGKGQFSGDTSRLLEPFEDRADVTLLERPFRINTLVSILRMALRSRRRQYEVRDLITAVQTANAELEQRVAQRTAQLNSSVKSLESFCHSLAHDLRAPVRAMRNFTRIILADYDSQLPDEARGMLVRVRSAGERMDMLIDDLLTLSRVSQAEVPLAKVDVSRVIAEALDELREEISDSKADVQLIPFEGKVQANVVILRQVLENFLSNALKYTRNGEHPRVRIHAEERHGRVRISVEDSGIGVPKEYHDRIFEVFKRLHGAEYPGTGVGLAIAKAGAHRMLGDVGVVSENGHGSSFWIELPAA